MVTQGSRPLVVIYGATATGKTRAALTLADRVGGEVVGADSVQVYRGFDVGSAKPTAEELGDVPHHMLDILDADEDIDAQRYADIADGVIADVWSRGGVPIVAGGTGLWLRALLRGLAPLPAVVPQIRERWESVVRGWTPHERLAELERVDPLSAGRLHGNDCVRIVRAFEVHEQTGRALGEIQREHALGEPRYNTWLLNLSTPRAEHDQRLEARTDSMIRAGFVDEVRGLLGKWGAGVRPLGSVGYREVVEHIRDGVDFDTTLKKIRRSTRLYARRQRTWANSIPDVDATLRIEDFLHERFLGPLIEGFGGGAVPTALG